MEPMSKNLVESPSQTIDIFAERFKPIKFEKFIKPLKLRDETVYVDAILHPSTIMQICRNHIATDTEVEKFEKFTKKFPGFRLVEKNNMFTLYTIAIAAERGNLPLINWLISKVGKEMLNMGDEKGRTPLFMACKAYAKNEINLGATLDGIKRLLKLKANPNILCDRCITPLNVAKNAKFKHALAKYLIKHDAYGVKW
jgi:hypothetical protein